MPASGRFSMGAPGLNSLRIAGGAYGPPITTTAYPSKVFATSVFDYDVEDTAAQSLEEDADLESMIIAIPEPEASTTLGPCTGKISLYAQTYLRGQQVMTENDVTDLAVENFDNLTTSIEVSGTCCWMLYSEPNFKGKMIQFKEGKFKSAADVGFLFRDVSSVQNIGRC